MKRKTLHAPFGPFTKNYCKVLCVEKVSQTSKSSLQSVKKIAKKVYCDYYKARLSHKLFETVLKKKGFIFVFNKMYVTVTEFEATTSSFVNKT